MDRLKRQKCPNEAGYTLMEMLIVVAILGMITMIATIAVSNSLKRQRLGVAAQQLASFAENGYIRAQSTGTGVFLTGRPNPDGSCTFSLYADSDSSGDFDPTKDTLLSTQLVTNDIVVQGLTTGTSYSTFGVDTWPSTGSGSSEVLQLYCDTLGRAMNPTGVTVPTTPQTPAGPGVQIQAPVVLSMTHNDMLSGNLRPKIRYDIQVAPIWHAVCAQVRY